MKLYEVGGSIRNRILGLPVKDLDFVFTGNSYEEMKSYLTKEGCSIYLERPEYFTIRAKIPKDFKGIKEASNCAGDFTLARLDGFYSDLRRPDSVEICDIYGDLSRRDCTMNAIAINVDTEEVIDPYEGRKDIEHGIIRSVGKTIDRVNEDPLRLLRYIRFASQLGFEYSDEICEILGGTQVTELVKKVEFNRIREELHKAFKANTYRTLDKLYTYCHPSLISYLFSKKTGIWLMPTNKE